MKIAGLDIGTTGCKCTVFDERGSYLGKAYRDYPVRRDRSGHEIDAKALMDSVWAVIAEMAAQYADIAGIGVTSFGETFVLTDAEGTPLYPSMLYTDPRGAEECAELVDHFGAERLAETTGLRPHEMYSLPKMMWLKRHHPEIWAKGKHVFQMEDYVVWHLTHTAQISQSLATRTMGLDIRTLEWNRDLYAAADVDISLMSRPVPGGTSAGKVTAEAAEKTGLSPESLVISVGQDQVGAAIGAGAFDASVAVDGAGTVECLTPVYDQLPDAKAMYDGYFAIVPYVVPGKYVAYAFSYTGGALIDWALKTFGAGKTNQQMEEAYGRDEPTGLLVLPHFAGAATPYMDTGSRGAILGLTTAARPADLYRACMEGVAYEMRLNYEHLQASGVTFSHLNATGGGARSKVWMQMKADILNLPITALKTADAGTVGSAIMTGIAVGLFRDLEDAARHMVEETETYLPRQDMHEKYMTIYERYKKLYNAVRPLM